MSIEFIKQFNESIIEATLEATDEEILSTLRKEGYPTQSDIELVHAYIKQAIKENRRQRLEQKKFEFTEYKNNRVNTIQSVIAKKSIDEMFADIIAVMQKKDKVPDGLLVAFREQSKKTSDEGIEEIWKNLMELGLIDPTDDEK